MAYIVISNLRVEEAVIESEANGFCLIHLPSTGARFAVRKGRLYSTKQEAGEHIRKKSLTDSSSPALSRRPTPYDYQPGGPLWKKENSAY